MRNILFLAIGVSVALSACESADRSGLADVVYLVRQAEPAVQSDTISDDAQDRAIALAHLLHDAGIKAIFTTPSPFAQPSVGPVADQFGLGVTSTEVADLAHTIAGSAGRSLAATEGEHLLQLVTELGGDPGPTLADNEFDRIYVLIPVDGGVRTLLHRYGQPYQD